MIKQHKVILPPDIPAEDDSHTRTLFLAGPIQGAPNWQAEAIRILDTFDVEFKIASPRRDTHSWNFNYTRQVEWETFYLDQAGLGGGVILFWLAKEIEHFPERAYAQTTRFELAEWFARNPLAIVVGIEKGFSGERYIRHRISRAAPGVPILDNLEATCAEAVESLR